VEAIAQETASGCTQDLIAPGVSVLLRDLRHVQSP
jgi:hypothetical protein